MMRRMVKQAAAVVLASGAGTRVGAGVNKVYLPLAGRRVVSWSLAGFARAAGIGPLVLVARPQDDDLVRWVLDREVDGGMIRHVEIDDLRCRDRQEMLQGARAVRQRRADQGVEDRLDAGEVA